MDEILSISQIKKIKANKTADEGKLYYEAGGNIYRGTKTGGLNLLSTNTSEVRSSNEQKDLYVSYIGPYTREQIIALLGKVNAGTSTTASNLGIGSKVFKERVGNDLRFRTLVNGSNISISEGASDITISLSGNLIDQINLNIERPVNQDYNIIVNAPYGLTINEVTSISDSGTCTATFKINTTALGGTANSVSTTEQTQSHSSANSVIVGDDFLVTISSNVQCKGAHFTIKTTRTL